jgi:hypothetical protein
VVDQHRNPGNGSNVVEPPQCLHLIATPSGLPITFALTNPNDDERLIARDMLEISRSERRSVFMWSM